MSEPAHSFQRFERYCDRLSRMELLVLHKVVNKRAAPVYREMFKGNWEAGMAAAQAKTERARLATPERV